MEFVLLIFFVLFGFLLGTLILGNFFSLAFLKLPGLFTATPKTPVRLLVHFTMETLGWCLALVSIVFLANKYLTGHQLLFYCGVCVSLAFHIGTLFELYGKSSSNER